jgi:hypothetical protein
MPLLVRQQEGSTTRLPASTCSHKALDGLYNRLHLADVEH